MSRSASARPSRLPALTVLALVGAVLGAVEIGWIVAGQPGLPRDLVAYLRAGDAFRAGAPLYTTDLPLNGAFLYAPTWALLFGLVSWLPGPLVWLLSALLNAAALRYVVGSWRGIGLAFLWPLTAFSLVGGNIDLVICAALVAVWRVGAASEAGAGGDPRGLRAPAVRARVARSSGLALLARSSGLALLALVALAKLAPMLAAPPRRWRALLAATLVLVLLTLPWAGRWEEWIAFLVRQPSSGEYLLSIPWWSRLPVALLLLLLIRRPWAAALAAAIATPALYWTSSVLLLAPLALWLDARRGRPLVDAGLPPDLPRLARRILPVPLASRPEAASPIARRAG